MGSVTRVPVTLGTYGAPRTWASLLGIWTSYDLAMPRESAAPMLGRRRPPPLTSGGGAWNERRLPNRKLHAARQGGARWRHCRHASADAEETNDASNDDREMPSLAERETCTQRSPQERSRAPGRSRCSDGRALTADGNDVRK